MARCDDEEYDPQKMWDEHWKEYVTNSDGSIDLEQLKKELCDASMYADFYQKVLCDVTGGAISKINTCPSEVIAVATDYFNETLEAEIKDRGVIVAHGEGAALIAQERDRQVDEEGYDLEHDALHTDGALAIAAACYAVSGLEQPEEGGATSYLEVQRLFTGHMEGEVEDPWPWGHERYDKRGKDDRVTLLIKAGALIAAEIDRLKALEV